MKKYSDEFKLEVVKYCLENDCSSRKAQKLFNLPTHSIVVLWINRYKKHGVEGILKNQISSYSREFKKQVVEYKRANQISYVETGNHFRISHILVKRWEQILKEEKSNVLSKETFDSKLNMPSKKKNMDKDKEKALLKEIEQLRMENEYLKKLNALVQERTKRENGKK